MLYSGRALPRGQAVTGSRMRLCAPLLLVGLIVGTLGCQPSRPWTPPDIVPPPAIPSSPRQQMATLAFLAYLGGDLEGSAETVEQTLVPCMRTALLENGRVNHWSLVWGPAVYKFSIAILDDNMMYVVRDNENPAHLAIVVRGTNPKAILDWLAEDFDVDPEVTWEYGNPPAGAKISKAISEGLLHLQTMRPSIKPGKGQTLTQFLKAQSKAYPSLQIDVAGHSLGGALAPTLALWLADTQSDWASGSVQFQVFALAGTTAGNLGLATYYDSRLGPQTDRMHNPYDIVPLAWNVETLQTMAGLYEKSGISPDESESLAIDFIREAAKDKDYSQIEPATPPLPGTVETTAATFEDQAEWQHHCGYLCALGIEVPLRPHCSDPPAMHCGQCPPESK